MTHAEQFYPGLHSADEQYSGAAYHMDSLVNLSGFRGWLGQRGNKPVRMVDIGCGKGRFLRDLVIILRDRWKVTDIQASGTDLVRSPGDLFAEISPNFHFVQHNLDGQVS